MGNCKTWRKSFVNGFLQEASMLWSVMEMSDTVRGPGKKWNPLLYGQEMIIVNCVLLSPDTDMLITVVVVKCGAAYHKNDLYLYRWYPMGSCPGR